MNGCKMRFIYAKFGTTGKTDGKAAYIVDGVKLRIVLKRTAD